MLKSLRQLCYPREFRIPPPAAAGEATDELRGVIANLIVTIQQEGREQRRFLADVSTGLWRLRQKMVQPGTGRPLEEMRRAYRHLESVWDALSQAGVRIQDHTDEPVPETGVYALKTIAHQPTRGLTRERVIETIKPSVYFHDEMIQTGEVIVGTPEAPDKPSGQIGRP